MFGWPNNPRDVHVDVILNPNNRPVPSPLPPGYPLPFRLESQDLTVGPNNLLKFKNELHPGFYIHYHLKDPHGTGLEFPDDEGEALWAEQVQGQTGSSPCPVAKPQRPFKEFWAKDVKPGNKVLVVRNRNENKAEFGYVLRVTKTPHDYNATFAHLDPPGDNTNGPSRHYGIAETLMLAGAVATAAFAAVTRFGFGFDFGENIESFGIALLGALTIGFAAAALWERLRRS